MIYVNFATLRKYRSATNYVCFKNKPYHWIKTM